MSRFVLCACCALVCAPLSAAEQFLATFEGDVDPAAYGVGNWSGEFRTPTIVGPFAPSGDSYGTNLVDRDFFPLVVSYDEPGWILKSAWVWVPGSYVDDNDFVRVHGSYGYFPIQVPWKEWDKWHFIEFNLPTFDRVTFETARIEGQCGGCEFTFDRVLLDDVLFERFMPTGDIDGSGTVDIADLNAVRNNFGAHTADGDTDLSGTVDIADLNLIRNSFGAQVTPAPEPASWLLALVAVAAIRCCHIAKTGIQTRRHARP